MDERKLVFVLKHFRDGSMQTEDALRKVRAAAGKPAAPEMKARWGRYAIYGAGVAAAVVAAFLIINTRLNEWTEYRADAAASQVTLSDGSTVTLAPGATARVQARKDPRHVELDGGAFFEVAHDESHPFTVSSGDARIRVLGTKFVVSDGDAGKSVDVVEGRVLFTAADREDGVILKKGMFAVLEDGATAPELHSGHLNPAAWATGLFSYDDARLRDALDELGGYYNVSLTVSPASASTQTFSGKFSTGSLDDIIYALESALGVKISRQ